MSEQSPAYQPTPAALPAAIAPALLSAERLAELQRIVDEERTNHAGEPVTRMGFWSAAVEALLAHVAALTARAETAEARVKEQQSELAEQERAKLLLIQETHRWSAAVKKLEAERVAPVTGFPGGNAAGYEAIRQQMAQRCAKCAGVVNAYGQCFYCDTTEPGLCN